MPSALNTFRRDATRLTSAGRLSVRAAAAARDERPVDETCGCQVCSRFSRAYLRHLLSVGEASAARLLTIHNLAWILDLMSRTRAAVSAGTLGVLRREVAAVWP